MTVLEFGEIKVRNWKRSRHDFGGHVDSVCTTESVPMLWGDHPDHIRAESDRIKKSACAPEPSPCCPSETRRSEMAPRKDQTLLDIIFKLVILLVLIGAVYALCRYAFFYGYEKGYWDGWFDARQAQEVQYPSTETAEGGPCRRWSDGFCQEAKNTQSAIQWSRHYLKRGDAESALERWTSARGFYRAAMDLGSGVGAQSAIYAAKRIQFQSMTCEYSQESLARIARGYEDNPLGALIKMKQKQAALSALGYYNGEIDNRHGPDSRAAIRDFQSDLWFDQTGVLTAEQTVLLVCGGAQIAKDISSQNMLGIMYAGGLGVRQNTDFSLDWLEAAAQRGDADASWNLALLYGTQTVLSSVQICDAVQNAERADSYLKEASDAGHPIAKNLRHKYASKAPAKRWSLISGDLNQPKSMTRVGRGCNPNN